MTAAEEVGEGQKHRAAVGDVAAPGARERD